MSRLRLSPAFDIVSTEAGLLVRSDLVTSQITGSDARRLMEKLLPLLDGSRDRAAILAALGGAPAAVAAFLDRLVARGAVEAVPEAPPSARARGQRLFFRAWSADADAATARLVAAHVVVAGRSRWAQAAARELAAAGVDAIEGPLALRDVAAALARRSESTLVIAAVPPEDTERLARLTQAASVPSLWARRSGTVVAIGPLVIPGQTACRVCAMETSVSAALSEMNRERAVRGGTASDGLLGHLVALEAIKVITRYAPTHLGGRTLIQDLVSWESTLHTLVRLPWCRVCGDEGRMTHASSRSPG
ncbi:TOMM biosynthesis cyclodehydratase protein C [Minicystis rosea]|nr:TOMM biosynthesis cyclodehydratase protein C [Minicystis rosea]